MDKLKALTDHLQNREILKKAGIKCNPEKIDSWAEEGTPEYLGDVSAEDGLYLFEHTYKATIELEEVAGDIRMLIALVLTWLEENDPDRDDLPERNVKWDGVPFDDGTSDLVLEIWFREKYHFGIVPADSTVPHIGYKGTNYTLGDEEMVVFEDEDPTIAVTVDD